MESSSAPSKEVFKNWGGTVSKEMNVLYRPTVAQIQEIVKKAKEENKKVRASGFRHSWSDVFGDKGGYQICLLTKEIIEDKNSEQKETQEFDPKNELQYIEAIKDSKGQSTGLIKMGAGTLNAQFLKWTQDKTMSKEDWLKWTVPFNVIMIEITYGGSNAPICHGAGIHSSTLSDLVREIEFVNANGALQKLQSNTPEEQELMKSASGALGLLGITTSLTMQFDKMSTARFITKKEHAMRAVPYPSDYYADGVEPNAKFFFKYLNLKLNVAKRMNYQKEFEERCTKNYYTEFFWFPFTKRSYVISWNKSATPVQSSELFGLQNECDEFKSTLMEGINKAQQRIPGLNSKLGGIIYAEFFGKMAMNKLAGLKSYDKEVPLIEAIHFRRGIQNMKVLDMEIEIPIPFKKDGVTLDLEIFQKAWWDSIDRVYYYKQYRGSAPMKITLEARIVGNSSQVTLSPFKVLQCDSKSKIGAFVSIEVLTVADHKIFNEESEAYMKEWHEFCQDLFELWSRYRDWEGNLLYPRPHLAKEWGFLKYVGANNKPTPIVLYLRDLVYKEEIVKFRDDLEKIGKMADPPFTLQDVKARFSNRTLSEIFF